MYIHICIYIYVYIYIYIYVHIYLAKNGVGKTPRPVGLEGGNLNGLDTATGAGYPGPPRYPGGPGYPVFRLPLLLLLLVPYKSMFSNCVSYNKVVGCKYLFSGYVHRLSGTEEEEEYE
jgi:hypothetical protein